MRRNVHYQCIYTASPPPKFWQDISPRRVDFYPIEVRCVDVLADNAPRGRRIQNVNLHLIIVGRADWQPLTVRRQYHPVGGRDERSAVNIPIAGFLDPL